MTIQSVQIAALTLDPANMRKHDQKSVDGIKASLQRWGQQKPIVVDSKNIVRAGNGTLMAAKDLGWKNILVVVSDLSGAELSAFCIADNRTAELSSWANEITDFVESLKIDLPDLDFSALGFDDIELPDIEPEHPDISEDEPPAPPANPITKTSDLWLLGDHRLLCGDSANAKDVARLMAGAKADMLLTDPPYGVSYVGKTKDALTVENDNTSEPELEQMVAAWFDRAQEVCRPGAYWYATVPAGPLHTVFALDWKNRGILRQIMVWVKDSLVLGHSEYHYRHEPILFGWVPGGERHKNSDRTRDTVWEVARPKASIEHPTMKPVALWALAIKDGSRSSEIIYEPFCGSGTTIIAAEQLGRKCYGMEISPQYCDVIVKRWETLTGKTAKLSNG